MLDHLDEKLLTDIADSIESVNLTDLLPDMMQFLLPSYDVYTAEWGMSTDLRREISPFPDQETEIAWGKKWRAKFIESGMDNIIMGIYTCLPGPGSRAIELMSLVKPARGLQELYLPACHMFMGHTLDHAKPYNYLLAREAYAAAAELVRFFMGRRL